MNSTKKPMEILEGFDLTYEERMFLLYYGVLHFSQTESYALAFKTRATGASICAMASKALRLPRIKEAMRKLTEYYSFNIFPIREKYLK